MQRPLTRRPSSDSPSTVESSRLTTVKMLGFEAFCLFFLVIVSYLLSKYVAYGRHAAISARCGCKPPPSTKQMKWLNGIDLALRARRLLNERNFLRESSLRFQNTARTFLIQFLGSTRIWTIEPQNIQRILQSEDFEMGWIRNKAFRPYLGNGVQATNGEVWAHGRALLRPSFKRAQVSNLELYEEHFQNFAILVPEDGSTIDIQKEFHRLTLDISTEILFGESVQCLQRVVSKETQELEVAFNYATKGVVSRYSMGPLIWLHWDPKFTRSVRTVQTYAQQFVEKAIQLRQELDNSDKAEDRGESGRYIFLEALAKDTGDRTMLRDQLVSMMAAGRSNTASLLSLVFYLLARHPSVLQKLRSEISQLNNKAPTAEQLKTMPYLRAVLDETLRTHPSAPANERAAKRDTVLPIGGGSDGRSPIYVRKGQTVFYHTYALHRSREIWGDDADEFRPERWAELRDGSPRMEGVLDGDEGGDGGRRVAPRGVIDGRGSAAGLAWKFIPFGAGPRVCPGQTLAITQTSYLTVRMLQTFSKLENRDEEPFEEGLGVVFNSARGVQVSLER